MRAMKCQERFLRLWMNVNKHNLGTLRETRKIKSLCVIFTKQILSIKVLSQCFYDLVFNDTFCSYCRPFTLGLDL